MKTLELSNTDGHFYESIPDGHVSQGFFDFSEKKAKSLISKQQMSKFLMPKRVNYVVRLFSPNSQSLGFVDQNQLNKVRIQVLKYNIQRMYIQFKGEKIYINPETGDLEKWPLGMFDQQQIDFAEIIRLKMAKKELKK